MSKSDRVEAPRRHLALGAPGPRGPIRRVLPCLRRAALAALAFAAALIGTGLAASPALAAGGIGGGHNHRLTPLTEAVIEPYVLSSAWTPALGWPPQECGCAAEQLSFPASIYWGSGLGGQPGLAERGDAAPQEGHMSFEALALEAGVDPEGLVRVAVRNEAGTELELTAAEALEEGAAAPYLYGEGASAAESSILLVRPQSPGQGISSGVKGWLQVVFLIDTGSKGTQGELEVGKAEYTETLAVGESATVEFAKPSVTNRTEDPNLAPPTYLWVFGDGTTSTEAAPKHHYEKCGTYTVTVRVKVNTVQGEPSGSGSSKPIKVVIPCPEGPTGPTGPETPGTGAGTETHEPPTEPNKVAPVTRAKGPPAKKRPHKTRRAPKQHEHHAAAPAHIAPPKPPKPGPGPPAAPQVGTPQGVEGGGGAGGLGGGTAGTIGTSSGGSQSGASPDAPGGPHESAPQTPQTHKPNPLSPATLDLSGVLVSASNAGGTPAPTPAAGSAPGETFAPPKGRTPAVTSTAVNVLGLVGGIGSVALLLGLGAIGELRPRWLLR